MIDRDGNAITTPCQDNPEPFDALMDHTNGPGFDRSLAAAKSMCATCPLMVACLNANRGEQWARAILGLPQLGRRRRTPKIAYHGTDSGYYAHLRRWGTKPCVECKRAHADTRRQKRVAA